MMFSSSFELGCIRFNKIVNATDRQEVLDLSFIGLEDKVGVESVLLHEFVEPFVYCVKRHHQQPVSLCILVLKIVNE
jgi:hypothetical protein